MSEQRLTTLVVFCPNCNERIEVEYEAPREGGAGVEQFEQIVCPNPRCKHAFTERLPSQAKGQAKG